MRSILRQTYTLVLLLVWAVIGCGGEGSLPPLAGKTDQFEKPSRCGVCHPTQHREWQGSIMHYAAMSPVFNAFELTVRRLTSGAFAPNGQTPNFCIECHSPTGVYNRELPDFVDSDSAKPFSESLSAVSKDGLSCDFCHTVSGPHAERSLLGDGIANVSLIFAPSIVKFGPLQDPTPNTYHAATKSDFIRSPQFCGGCHDVRIPKEDKVTGEPFQRLENLFTEWEQGPYASTANPYGKVIRCQDCHMSLYPMTEPGVFPTTEVGSGLGSSPERRHAIHAFTAVSIPFIDDERFPNVDTEERDAFGYPLGQEQRRTQMLRAACTLTLEGTPKTLTHETSTIPVRVVVTNVGAGHRVPAGFSQEREVWVELTVSDDIGVIYESGYLRDKAHPETGENEPDGLLHDEDLEDHKFHIDYETLDTTYEAGPDRDQRPAVNLGIKNFQNHFIRIGPDGKWEPVLNPLLADHMDNSRSLPMLQPVIVPYDIPMPERPIVGYLRVKARLRYRTFPPKFLRMLAIREPALISEDIVDRNTIVDMAEVESVIEMH